MRDVATGSEQQFRPGGHHGDALRSAFQSIRGDEGPGKHTFLNGLRCSLISMPFRWLVRDRALIFMLHRLAAPDLGVEGIHAGWLRSALEFLCGEGHPLVSLDSVLDGDEGGAQGRRTPVAFTLDDGYFDQAEIAAPIFAEFDCPVTIFLTTGFLDRELWLWWDRIEFVFENTGYRELEFSSDGVPFQYRWDGGRNRDRCRSEFVERCKTLSEQARERAIDVLRRTAGVDLPEEAPAKYAPMTWSEVRSCEERGIRFGAHTRTHPILSRLSEPRAREEIAGSASRLAEQASSPSRVFCYPNGRPEDFGEREIEILRDLDFRGAVTASQGYAAQGRLDEDTTARFCVPRFSFPQTLLELLQLVTGFERFKSLVRGE